MTRMQVAKALGRSLATVRRIEGQLLFPRRDAGGVWRFNPKKVAVLVRQVKAGKSLASNFKPDRTWTPFPRGRPPADELRRLANAVDTAMRALRSAQRLLRNA